MHLLYLREGRVRTRCANAYMRVEQLDNRPNQQHGTQDQLRTLVTILRRYPNLPSGRLPGAPSKTRRGTPEHCKNRSRSQ